MGIFDKLMDTMHLGNDYEDDYDDYDDDFDDEPEPRGSLFKKKDKKYDYEKDKEIKLAIQKVEEEFAGNGRVLIRPSGTEPLVRVMIEGKDSKIIEDRARTIAQLIEKKCK